jgi:serine/threonine protein kinase
MLGQIEIIEGPDKGRIFTLNEGQTVEIGRGEKTSTKLRDPRVSRKHCQLTVEDGRYRLACAGGAGGTLVNGKPITQCELRLGDVVRIGDTQFRLLLADAHDVSTVVPVPPKSPPPATATQLCELVGKTLSHYQVHSVVAKGRSGVVFKATDTRDNQTVALKVLLPEFSSQEEEMQRFVRSMKTVLQLRHPNLISVLGAGKTGAHCWIAMEYVEGESLTQIIKRIGTANMLDWRYALRVAIHTSRALDFAHQHSIIHRNITPTNIVVRTSDKSAKLGDLMLAKALEGALAEQITRPGEIVGDLAYMSPERTRGSNAVDGRSDIYSLGATVYALLTGRPPCEGDSMVETIHKIRQTEPAKPKKYQLAIPDLFEGVVMRMLEKRQDDRFQTPAELLTDLERVAKYQGVSV